MVGENITVPYEVLVDSGADVCIFDAQIAEILGISVAAGEPSEMVGATGVPAAYYVHPVKIKVGGWQYDIKAGFMPGIGKFGYGVVGQRGFFDNFIVKFDLAKEQIELKRRAE